MVIKKNYFILILAFNLIIFIILCTISIYFRFTTERISVHCNGYKFTSFPTYKWVRLSNFFPYSELRLIDGWGINVEDSNVPKKNINKIFLKEIYFKNVYHGKKQLLSSMQLSKSFKISSNLEQWYITNLENIPVELISSTDILVKIIVEIHAEDGQKTIEVEFLHEIKKEKEYSNILLDWISGV